MFRVNGYHVALGACCKHKGKNMKKFKMKPKLLMVALTVTALLPIGGFAQEGLFQHGVGDGNGSPNSLMNKSESTVGGNLIGQSFGSTGAEITGQTFGTPLGSGLFVMLAAGAGYVTIKSRKKQNGKEK